MITINRVAVEEAGFTWNLDGAISAHFGKGVEVVKDGVIGAPYGTVEIDGVAYDWKLKVGHYSFVPA